MYTSNYRRRFDAVFALFLLFLVIAIFRLFFIQIFRSNYFESLAKKQHNLFIELEPRRGTIFDTNLKPQAVNITVDSLYACPNDIPLKDKQRIIQQLMPILGLDYNYLKDRLYRNKSFIWIARKITPQQSEAIKGLKIKGLDFMKETKRCYPNGYLASQVIGFADTDNVGLEDLELYYNNYLKGEPGWALFLRDARQKKLALWEKMAFPKDGYNIIMTIDETIQYIAERELDKAYRAYHAKGASIVVMDPHTGAVLALANRPTFDLNNYSKADNDARRDRAICDLFEPGSVFKSVTASALLEEKKVVETDKFFCENGSYKFSTHILHDHRPHGTLTFREVIEQSSNIGTAKAAQRLGPDLLYHYIRLFGFGSKTGIDLPGEISGIAREPRFWSKVSMATIPMGQEIGVTALQLANGMSVIANGGQLMKPFIVREINDKYGEVIKEFSPVMIRKVISVDTANRMKSILKGVVDEGTGTLGKLSGFSAAGKTGTAQKLEENGTYSHSKFMASFVGFAPVEDPVIVIAVIIDEPHPYYGGVVSAPVFKNVANDVLRYLNSKQGVREASISNENKRVN